MSSRAGDRSNPIIREKRQSTRNQPENLAVVFPPALLSAGFVMNLGGLFARGSRSPCYQVRFCVDPHTACGMAGPTHAVLLSVLLCISPARAFHGSPAVPHLSHRRYSSSSPPVVFLLPKIVRKSLKKSSKFTDIGNK